MKPAFSSSWQAGLFSLVVAVTLCMPALVCAGWLDRRQMYPAIPYKFGPFPYIQQKIFDSKGDVDVAILGSSHIWCSIDTPYLQKQFSEKLGRESEVFTLGWPWAGYDAIYVIARDLMSQRHVKMLVIYDDQVPGTNKPHPYSSRWFWMGENSEAMHGLPVASQIQLYGMTVLGMPRELLSTARPNLMEDPANCRPNFWNTYYHAPNVGAVRGSLRAKLGFGVTPDFAPFKPCGSATPGDFVIYSPQTKDSFQFTGVEMVPYQLHFARLLARLCQDHGTRLVMMHVPEVAEFDETKIVERQNWTEVLGAPVDIVGIPPNKFFSGIAKDDVLKLYYTNDHMNQNGQEFFTPLITPTLLKLYAESDHH